MCCCSFLLCSFYSQSSCTSTSSKLFLLRTKWIYFVFSKWTFSCFLTLLHRQGAGRDPLPCSATPQQATGSGTSEPKAALSLLVFVEFKNGDITHLLFIEGV